MDNRQLQRRGDSFDIGESQETTVVEPGGRADITSLLSNPEQLINSFDLTPDQAQNVKSIITAGGTGLAYKWLSRHIGDELAGAVGGFASAYVAKKLLGRNK